MAPRRFLHIAAVLLGLVARPGGAQTVSCSGTDNCSPSALLVTLVNLPTLSTLSTTSSTFSVSPSGGVTASDFVNGYILPASALTVTVRTNAAANTISQPSAMRLTMQGGATAFNGTSCALTLSDVTYATSNVAQNLRTTTISSTAATTLLTALTSSNTPASAALHFRIAIAWGTEVPAASCTLPLTFTVAP